MSGYSHNILIVSDLHLSEGFLPQVGKWSPNEDFLSDVAFADFLRFHEEHRQDDLPWKLIIAGDGFDFLQVTSRPASDAGELEKKISGLMNLKNRRPSRKVANPEQRREQALIRLDEAIHLMIDQTPDTHRDVIQQAEKLKDWGHGTSVDMVWELECLVMETWILAFKREVELSKNELEYGPGTTWPEAVWKTDRIAEGHPIFFSALAWFLDRGNSLVILKGNHDIELFWPEVQDRFRDLLFDASADLCLADPPWAASSVDINLDPEEFYKNLQENFSFEPWIYFEPGMLYLEHGNQYELFDVFEDFLYPVLPDRNRLIRLPPGSFFVRYFFNKIEEAFPFADNLRPIPRFITWAFEQKFRETVKLLWTYRAGLFRFTKELIARTWKDYRRDRKEDKTREALRKGDVTRNDISWLIDADHSHARNLNKSAQGPLKPQHLLKIEEIALKERIHPVRKILHFGLVALPIILIVLGLLLTIIVPAIWALGVSDTIVAFTENYIVRVVITGVLGFVIKILVGPWILKRAEGEDYLFNAAKNVWKVLQKPFGSESAPLVEYIVFGHTHDPNMCRLDEGLKAPWYVNTGSWVQTVDEVDSWDQLERDFSYLQIVTGQKMRIPGLYRWNRTIGQPERIRRRSG